MLFSNSQLMNWNLSSFRRFRVPWIAIAPDVSPKFALKLKY
jgi:hypothetical protein